MGTAKRSAWPWAWWPRLGVAAVAVMLLIASVSLWVQRSARERAFSELADMHVSTLASANPVDVISSDRHTVKPWFAGRIPFSFNLPELQGTDFTLVGGRVAYFRRNPGAQLIFGLRKHELSVFIFPEHLGDLPFSSENVIASRLAFQMETWSQGGLRYFVIGDTPASDIHSLSELLKKAAH